MSGKRKHKPEHVPASNTDSYTDSSNTPSNAPGDDGPASGPRTGRRKAGLIAATGAITATAAIAGALAVTDGGSAQSEQVASSSRATGAPSPSPLAARDVPRAGRAADRPALTAAKPKAAKPKAAKPKARPEAGSAARAASVARKKAAKKKAAAAQQRRAAESPATGGRTCGASYYHEPQDTASGEPFNPNALTAAHKSLPLGSRVRVTNVANGETVTVRINDRGPYAGGRCLDLSRAAFDDIGSLDSGVIKVRYQVL